MGEARDARALSRAAHTLAPELGRMHPTLNRAFRTPIERGESEAQGQMRWYSSQIPRRLWRRGRLLSTPENVPLAATLRLEVLHMLARHRARDPPMVIANVSEGSVVRDGA